MAPRYLTRTNWRSDRSCYVAGGVSAFYDIYLRSWTLMRVDGDHTQIGSAEYAPNRKVAERMFALLVREAQEG